MIGKAYNRECDMWSVGVILFTLMCGYPPFWGDTEREIYGRVKRGHYAFEGPDWQVRSQAAKDLVNQLLVMQPSSRCARCRVQSVRPDAAAVLIGCGMIQVLG